MSRASTTSDVFNAIAEADRRAILNVLMTGEKAAGTIVNSSGAGRKGAVGCTAWMTTSKSYKNEEKSGDS